MTFVIVGTHDASAGGTSEQGPGAPAGVRRAGCRRHVAPFSARTLLTAVVGRGDGLVSNSALRGLLASAAVARALNETSATLPGWLMRATGSPPTGWPATGRRAAWARERACSHRRMLAGQPQAAVELIPGNQLRDASRPANRLTTAALAVSRAGDEGDLALSPPSQPGSSCLADGDPVGAGVRGALVCSAEGAGESGRDDQVVGGQVVDGGAAEPEEG